MIIFDFIFCDIAGQIIGDLIFLDRSCVHIHPWYFSLILGNFKLGLLQGFKGREGINLYIPAIVVEGYPNIVCGESPTFVTRPRFLMVVPRLRVLCELR